MPRILISYFSHSGNTRKMAEKLEKVIRANGCEVELKRVEDTGNEDLAACDGLLIGSPCYFGDMAAPVKELIDKSIPLFGKGALVGKPGGAFCSTGGIGGGGELVLNAILQALMIHGMVVQGLRKGGHFGPLAIGEPDERVMDECDVYGRQFSALVKKLAE